MYVCALTGSSFFFITVFIIVTVLVVTNSLCVFVANQGQYNWRVLNICDRAIA